MSPKKKTMIFLTSQAVTLFGSTLVQMAIVWYVTLNTGEGAWIAAFTVASCDTSITVFYCIAERSGFSDPMTAGIFVSIAAWASFQRREDETP